jgi:outer membrane biosynthesis protein TonB
MSLNNLISKVLAGGLAAGVFLFWWPAHLPSTGGEWLVLRGLAWALAYEVLMLSFCPLENLAARSMPRRRTADRARRVLSAAPQPAKAGGAVLLACTGLLLPATMLAHARNPLSKPAPRLVQVVREIVVRKVVRQKTVVVRPPAVVQTPAPVPRADSVTPAPAAKKQRKPATSKPATKAKAEAKQTTTKAEPEQDPAPTPATTPSAPPSTSTPPDPAGVAAPSAGTTTSTADGQ